MTGLWAVRCHLWLSQSMLQQEDRACLLRLPVEPSAMFKPDASRMLQQAQEARRCACKMSSTLRQSRPWCQPWENSHSNSDVLGLPGDMRISGFTSNHPEGVGLVGLDRVAVARGHASPRTGLDGMLPRACRCLREPCASWKALGAGPWVVSTMTEGYRLQFLSTPPVTKLAIVSTMADLQHRTALHLKILALLAKSAIKEVHPPT